jgi:outer membrane protein TolC
MRRPLTIFFLVLGLPIMALSTTAKKVTLRDCYQLAVKNSETASIADEDIQQVRAQYQQVIGAITPQVSLSAAEMLQEKVATTDAFSTTFNRFSTPGVAVSLTQPIFHGFIDLYGLRFKKAELKEKGFLKKEALRNLFQDVASTYYSIATLERAIQTTNLILSALYEQSTEMNHWWKLGKIRESELAAHTASVAILEAGLEKMRGERQAGYEVLSYLTGTDEKLTIVLENPLDKKILSVADYLNAAAGRSDVQAAKQRSQQAKEGVRMAKGKLYPGLDVDANYYPYRTGVQEDIDWDVTFSMSLPVFNLTNLGKIKEAKSIQVQSQLQEKQRQRLAESEIKRAHTASLSSLAQLKKFQNAATLASRSYDLSYQDYHLGMTTQLDVLMARQSFFETLQERNAAEVHVWLNWINLQTSAGVFP